jgi:hypothetical protein
MFSSCLKDWRSTQNCFAVYWWPATDVLPRAQDFIQIKQNLPIKNYKLKKYNCPYYFYILRYELWKNLFRTCSISSARSLAILMIAVHVNAQINGRRMVTEKENMKPMICHQCLTTPHVYVITLKLVMSVTLIGNMTDAFFRKPRSRQRPVISLYSVWNKNRVKLNSLNKTTEAFA